MGVLGSIKKLNRVLRLQFARVHVQGNDKDSGIVHKGHLVYGYRLGNARARDRTGNLEQLSRGRLQTERTVLGMNQGISKSTFGKNNGIGLESLTLLCPEKTTLVPEGHGKTHFVGLVLGVDFVE